MCGIIGAVAQRNVAHILVEGLKRLEYRGYDSAGVSILDPEQGIQRVRALGKVAALAEAVERAEVTGQIGIAHTRWATHGKPSEANAHPHNSHDKISLVHNGIIENHAELREQLQGEGYQFASETDSEVVAHLIHKELKVCGDWLQAVRSCVAQLRGAYALAILKADEPNRMIAVRRGSPLLLGLGVDEYFVASSTQALVAVTQQFVYLNDGDIVDIDGTGYRVEDAQGQAVDHPIKHSELSAQSVEKGEYKHYMLKEIYEQPDAIRQTLMGRVSAGEVNLDGIGSLNYEALSKVENIHLIACGTSYHAAFVSRYWLEHYAGVPCSVEIASEYRYRTVQTPPNTLYITLSQSGETADSLAALEKAQSTGKYLSSLAICNVDESSLTRLADATILTHAGPEIGVASTKAFTTQLVALLLTCVAVAKARGVDDSHLDGVVEGLNQCPSLVDQVLGLDKAIETMAEDFIEKEHTIFLGRGPFFPVALEGALKLKEISYIHAEGYPAGELKHGPLALVDSEVPVVAVAPNDALLEKLKSNLEEVRARGGRLYVIAEEGTDIHEGEGIKVLRMPACPEPVAPILFTIPLQLLSYHVAVMRGTDVDQPRNLAKSVTVE